MNTWKVIFEGNENYPYFIKAMHLDEAVSEIPNQDWGQDIAFASKIEIVDDLKYVKLVAKPNTWFKEGTEVYAHDSTSENKRRLTVDEWEMMEKVTFGLLKGIWVATKGFGAIENCGFIEGKEYFIGDCIHTDELEVTFVDDPV